MPDVSPPKPSTLPGPYLPLIPSLANPILQAELTERINGKTKPLGALGQLERLALQLGMIQNSNQPNLSQPQICVFAADHGLARHGTSAYPSAVTAQMVHNILRGGAAISVFARQHVINLQVVDAGVATDLPAHPQLLNHKIRHASRDALTEPAMSDDECMAALKTGMAIVRQLPGNILMVGEMGIGNTSAASLLLARLGKLPLSACIGRGTGLDDAGLSHKEHILTQVLARHTNACSPFAALAALGGLEIAMMTGALIEAASQRRILLMDGFIAGVALLVAEQLAPGVCQYAVFAHQSAEPGHRHLLALLDAEPLLQLQLRLGEGSGAALAYPLLQSACLFLSQMASFKDAGISEQAQ
ncbi:nicotinate-nucleotide--dimethylbenzimidazole phosphoribosyltransferase [Oceanisphaera profunda]|uniref:Nicotinate-nucleotide--dimethylbenzimidazole phosphoribosyltransferase n=1 Tax=Oceanisphaera profunda TaxID=1416627 RepID=A0A1Y0D247_9GAMM|nr:nicotinate-nucleotide--dimethylbenzimidazole phosphoribosyltransferase [Oceanisphaera profunda]ART81600.1 nicotinate-nucleotide--dimethylbenzimidazole phosphoribosyltransferase [Oceanisphaera profunda]